MSASPAVAAAMIRTAQGGSISAGVWTLVGVIVTTIGLIAVAVIKQKGPWAKAASDDRAADFVRLREEIRDIKEDAKAAREEARRVADIAQRLENMVACMRPAISILSAEVKRLDPDNPNNPALVQVQELMAMAAAGDLGIGKAMNNLATIKAPGE